VRFPVLALAFALLLPGHRTAAQEPPGDQEPAQEGRALEQGVPTSPSETGAGEGKPGEQKPGDKGDQKDKKDKTDESLPPGEIRVKAETQGGDPSHHWARGFVDLRAGDIRIQGDAADIYEIEKPDGTKKQQAVFVGNVVFLREDERLAGDRLTMDLDTGKGVFEKARGYMQPGMFVEASSIERVDADSYRVHGGTFTACAQPNPRWNFSATSARVEVDDKVVAKNVLFNVKNIPVFYFPYFVYPIQEDQRATGFLFPHIGSSSLRGFTVGAGFFWAMGRSFDQTFYADHYSKFGYGFGHEFRYALDSPSNASFHTYVFWPKDGGDRDYDVDWRALQALPGKVRASVNVRWYSNTLFQERFQDTLNLASSRTQRAQLNVQRSFRAFTLSALAEDNRTFYSEQTRVNRRLPSFRINRPSKKIGNTDLVLALEGRAEGLTRGNNTKVDRYGRYHLAPQLSYPLVASFLQLNPRLVYDYTRYSKSKEDTGGVVGPALDRRFFESGVEIQGPNFSHVFNNPGGFYSEKFKHVIGPELNWRYRTRIEDFSAIPKFDGIDQQLGTNQLDYALVQRLLAKRPGFGGKLQAWEFLSWRLGQTYYVQIKDAQNEFDPNYSSSAFGPGGLPDHNSPLQSRLRIRPTPGLAGSFDLEYDVNFRQLRTLAFGVNLQGGRAGLTANWSRARKLAVEPADRERTRDFIRGIGSVELLPGRLTLDGGVDYDILRKNLVQSRARLRWDVQCCGFIVEAIQYDYNERTDHQIRVSIELANLGAIGNFLGEDPGSGRASSSSGFGGSR
jgi:LPS-assembly protein